MNNQLDKYRDEIDKLDFHLIETLAKRMKFVQKVGEFKKNTDMPALAPKRWEEILTSRRARAEELDLDPQVVEAIFTLIHEYGVKTVDAIIKG